MSASSTTTPIFISQNQSGFPGYLDFSKMRTQAIEHLGPITSAYWTDYNEHDPGITTLEALLYALLDLGYRVNWPIQDLLTQKNGSPETDFLTPGEALGSNPFTINDYRKRLMDLKAVRNAWLEVSQSQQANGVVINGIYSVFLELEEGADDFATTGQWEKYSNGVLTEVGKVLQAHRNLCEDFSDSIVIMGKQPYIVKADIELSAGATIAEVYQALIKNLYDYFSPAPTYYTLPQLVAKGISLAQVFGGRPFVHRPSYGFILDSELPALTAEGTRVIYSSEVYNLLLKVPGIDSVRNLAVQQAPGGVATAGSGLTAMAMPVWVLPVQGHTLPVLSVAGSSFNWFLNGQQLSWSPGTAANDLQKTLAFSGKVLYPYGPALDGIVPAGQYLADLGTYYSIQNDFPEVYGIGPGGLPATATVKRQAQALQFKGYLLFFEQLMADFLVQLTSVRSLLSMKGGAAVSGDAEDDDPEDKTGWGADIDPAGTGGGSAGTGGGGGAGAGGGGGSALFSPGPGDLSNVPDLDALLQFPTTGTSAVGATLTFPVDAHVWHALVRKGPVTCEAVGKLSPYLFPTSHERDLAVAELQLSFAEMPPAPVAVALEGGKKQVFVIQPMRHDLVLLSKSLFDTSAAALASANSALFAGASKDYYTLSVLTEEGKVGYSFSVGQSAMSYSNYVNQLLTNPQQNIQQRANYLLHLIDRFAESYTDYAQLSAGFLSTEAIADNEVGLMQRFLNQLPMLAGDRCKGFNYSRGGWDNTNVSGLELRFKAYCGIADSRRHYLCPFEVASAERQYRVLAVLGEEAVMSSPGSFTEEAGYGMATELFHRMQSATNYRIVRGATGYRLVVDLPSGVNAESIADWPDEAAAAAAAAQLVRMLRPGVGPEDIRPDRIEWRVELVHLEGDVVRTARHPYADEASAFEEAGKKIHDLKAEKYWNIPAGRENVPGKLERSKGKESPLYLDMTGLSMTVKYDIPHKPEHGRYVVSDEAGFFSFAGTGHYPTASAGRHAAHGFPFQLTEAENFQVQADKETGTYRLAVLLEGEVTATEARRFDSETEAQQRIMAIVTSMRRRLYVLRVVEVPLSWKFLFVAGLPGRRDYVFASNKSYGSLPEARAAADEFYQADTGWELTKDGKGFYVEKSGGFSAAVCSLEPQEGMPAVGELENELLRLVVARSQVLALEQGNREALGSWLRPDERFPESGYVYRLVDKDRPRAFHPMAEGKEDDPGRKAAETARRMLIEHGLNGYVYPEFCLGGDNVFAKQDPSGNLIYHYAIRCRNDYFHRLGLEGRDKEWMLFVSIAGYGTEDAAQQAFMDNYLHILEKAMERVNYGEKDPIAWDEHGRRLAVVYVPEETRLALERAGLNAAGELVKAARAYPIRRVKRRYIFQLSVAGSEERDWISAGRFASAQDAHTAFDYFRLLLQEARNYFVDYDDDACSYRVGIREVLAESMGSFRSAEEAWGREGIQQFIGASQQAGGWHPEKQGGRYWGYFIACPDKKALHPCTYESERLRDAVLEQLFAAAQGFPVGGWLTQSGTTIQLADPLDGHVVAVFPAPGAGAGGEPGVAPGAGAGVAAVSETVWDLVLDLLDAVWAGLFFEDAEGLYVKAGGGMTLVRPATSGVGRDRWEDELLRYGAYLPVVRTTITGAASQYRLEIKLPGFAALPGKEYTDKACGCPPEKPGEQPACYAAWISEINFASAMDVWNVYQTLLPVFSEKNNYRPVHDEAALEYGIELLAEEAILAHSVQRYFYARMAGRAMDRAKECVNGEGLNVIEHVLLRPDKGVTAAIPTCAAGTNPVLPPLTGAASVLGPLTTAAPGGDPYSFVMTVFLPAWPQRFRKTANRQLLESIIQQEVPAHILPRILWLTPMDMCRMESGYKQWLHWLNKDRSCGNFKPEEFIQSLFNTPQDCMWEAGCSQDVKKEKGDEWLSQINQLYCWADSECAGGSEPAPVAGALGGPGSAGNASQSLFGMSGLQLQRPKLTKTIAEKKPVPPPPPAPRPARHLHRRPVETVAQPRVGIRLWVRIQRGLKTGGRTFESWVDSLAKWGSALLQRLLARRRNK